MHETPLPFAAGNLTAHADICRRKVEAALVWKIRLLTLVSVVETNKVSTVVKKWFDDIYKVDYEMPTCN